MSDSPLLGLFARTNHGLANQLPHGCPSNAVLLFAVPWRTLIERWKGEDGVNVLFFVLFHCTITPVDAILCKPASMMGFFFIKLFQIRKVVLLMRLCLS